LAAQPEGRDCQQKAGEWQEGTAHGAVLSAKSAAGMARHSFVLCSGAYRNSNLRKPECRGDDGPFSQSPGEGFWPRARVMMKVCDSVANKAPRSRTTNSVIALANGDIPESAPG
jgi:hypothetical protein